MSVDAFFVDRVAPLYVPSMGTERAAPFLYELVRMIRPRRALEVGMGYTTPFLAQALVDAEGDADAAGEPAEKGEPYEPRLVAVDDLTVERSSARGVAGVLEELGLERVVTPLQGSLAEAREALAAEGPFDFVWIDAWAALEFFDRCWDLVAPDGGLTAFHYLVGYEEGEAILEYMKATQHLRPGELELLSLVEPHKLEQNSVTLVRRTLSGAEEAR